MTRILPISLTSIVFLFLVTTVSAQTTTVVPTKAEKVTTRAAAQDTKKDQQLTNLQGRATKEIDRRLTALNGVLTKISAIKKLSTDEKTTLTTQVQAEIKSLTDLKSKVAAASDITTLRADVATIVTNYRIFALFVPKIHLLAGADIMGQSIDLLTIVSAKLETRIKEAEAAGRVVTNLTKTHEEMKTSLAEAKKSYESIVTNVTPLKPEEYPANKATLTNGRGLLRDGKGHVQASAKSAREIMTALKAFRPAATDASTSATPAAQ